MLPVEVTGEGSQTPGRVETESGTLRWLNVAGTPAAMGRQVGTRLADTLRRGPLPVFSKFLDQFLRDSPVTSVSELVEWATDRWISDRLVDGLSDEYRAAATAMARGADMHVDDVLRAQILPETLLWLVGTYHRLRHSPRARGLGRPPVAGCTSAVVTPPAASTVLHGRNLDFFGVDFWESAATVTFYHPSDGLDYVTAGSAGILTGGITAMNAAGLTVAAHQHFIDSLDLDGVPMGVAAERAMRRARTLEEAVDILDAHPPVAGWTYVLTEGDTGRAVVYETTPEARYVYRTPSGVDHFGYSNVFWGPELEDAEVDFYPEYGRDTRARQQRALRRTDELGDRQDTGPEDIAELLADFVDPDSGERKVVGRGIAAVHTVTSVVFEPEARRIWVGSGDSPASCSWFVPFRLDGPHTSGGGGPDLEARPFHPNPGWDRSNHGQAFQLYRDAYRRWRQGESDKRLLIALEHALALFPEDGNLHLLAGLMALRTGRARRAEGAFRRALERTNDLPRRSEIELYLAWSLDLRDERAAARHLYHEVAHAPSADPVVRRRAKNGRWLQFTQARADKLPVDFIHVGVP